MGKREQNSDSRIASLKGQNAEYNEMYRKWRIEHKQNYGFYFSGNSDEVTWRDGEGFVTDYPEASERSAVKRIASVVAQTLILFTLIDIICTIFFHDKLFFGKYVDYDPHGFFTGDEGIALVLSYAVNILRRIIPVMYIFARLKMPLKLAMPLKVTNKPLFNAAAPISLLSYGIISMMMWIANLTGNYFGIFSGNKVWIPENKSYVILSSLLFAVIIPIISEVVHRGVFLQIFRQFGDGYALIVTSLIAALTANDVQLWVFTFAYSLIIGYFTLRSGSILTAILMRIIFSTNSYWLTYFKQVMGGSDEYLTVSLAIFAVYIIVGLIFLIKLMKKHSAKICLPIFSTYVSQKEKLVALISDPHMLIWISFAVASSAVNMVML